MNLARQLTSEVLLDEFRHARPGGRSLRDVSTHVTPLEWPWQFVNANIDMLHRDWNTRWREWPHCRRGSYLVNSDGITSAGNEDRPVSSSMPKTALSDGDNVTIRAHSYIQGPAYIGSG